MPTTLTTALTAVRERLNESLAGFWKDAELTRWINEGTREVCRRTECLRSNDSISAVAGTATYALPVDAIRVHRVEYTQTGGIVRYPLDPVEVNAVDALGWSNTQTRGIPQFFVTWGYPGNATLNVFPKPATTGTFTVWYYRLPVEVSSGSDELDLPEGWQDVVYDYCEYMARMKDKDQQWQAAKAQFDDKLADLFALTRDLHDNPSRVASYGSGNLWWQVLGNGPAGWW